MALKNDHLQKKKEPTPKNPLQLHWVKNKNVKYETFFWKAFSWRIHLKNLSKNRWIINLLHTKTENISWLETGQGYNPLNHYEPRIFASKIQKDQSTKTGYCTETIVFTDGRWQKQRQTQNIIRSQNYCSHIPFLESKWVLFKRENSNLLLEFIEYFSCTILKGGFFLCYSTYNIYSNIDKGQTQEEIMLLGSLVIHI